MGWCGVFRVFDSRYTFREQLRPVVVVERGSALGAKIEVGAFSATADDDVQIVDRDAIESDRSGLGYLNPPVWAHLVHDAETSDLFLGETPETWSPLGSTDLASAGGLVANLEALQRLLRERTSDPLFPEEAADTEVEFTADAGVAVLSVRESGRVRAAATFTAFSLIVPIPPGSSGLDLDEYPLGIVEEDIAQRESQLEVQTGTLRVRRLLVWRLYRGDGSSMVDGVTELRDGGMRVQFPTVERGAYMVGRLALSAGKIRTRNDPFRRLRMAKAEAEDGFRVVREIPRIEHAWPEQVPTVIAVHGTMSTAIPMARELDSLVPQHRIVRFEHDTWHSIVQNSDLLAYQISRLGAERVSLVAHSRGGLVARRAAEILSNRARDDLRVIALGTPFGGTELIDQARGGLLGARVALGALRVLTGGMIDPISRMASLLFRKLPPGLEQMSPTSLFQTAYAGRTSTADLWAAAGDVDAEGAPEVAGIALSALYGLARAGYGQRGMRGDLVVSVESATTDVQPQNTRLVASDHFSYLLHDDVKQLIRDIA